MKKNYPYHELTKVDTFLEMITLKYKEMPNKEAYSYNDNDVKVIKTYKDVYNDVLNLTYYMHKKYKNKHIGIMAENSYRWLILFYSIITSGNIVTIIDKEADKDKLDYLLKSSDTDILFYSSKYVSFIDEVKCTKFDINDIDKFIKEGNKYSYEIEKDPNRDAAIFFTSGTTGPNKAVLLSEYGMVWDVLAASTLYYPYGGVVAFLPFHHAFGLITGAIKPFNYGVPTFINGSLKYIQKDIKENHPQTLFAVPLFMETFYKMINKSIRQKGKEKSFKFAFNLSKFLLKLGIDVRKKLFKEILDEFGGKLEYVICGGAFLDEKYVKWFRVIGIEVLNGYGITECSPVISVNRPFYHEDGSVGVPCKGVDVKIIDGEICIGGPLLMKGYYKNDEETKSVMYDGYFHTGDLGYISKGGFIHITGRKKNLIILSNGENISPELIENALLKDDGVCEVVVYEKDDKIVAEIFPEEDYLQNQEYFDKLIYRYNEGKAKNQQVAYAILRSAEFEKNSSKKILRSKVGGK